MDYPIEHFSAEERARLTPHFTNLDRPVFGLVNLPETVKGALFARYARHPGTLRRLFIDEFASDLPGGVDSGQVESARASALYERVFLEYGDDSVAQLGGAHIACEWVSNVLTKILQRPRLGAYLEQSTRYIAYDQAMPDGRYRYLRDPQLGPDYERSMDLLFDTYAQLLPRVTAWASETFPPAAQDDERAHARATRAKALDVLRGLLPAASLSHMGIFASGQTFELLILHLKAHPLPEAQRYGQLILEALQAMMPSFVVRVERDDRGGEWIDYLRGREEAGRRWAHRLGIERTVDQAAASVRLLHVDGTEEALLAALLFEAAGTGEEAVREGIRTLSPADRSLLLAELCGDRRNRRYRPGRGFEALRYRFEVVSDYGAFRDLQRHRLLTVQWQALTPDLGATVPVEMAAIGVADAYRRALDASAKAYENLCDRGLGPRAAYALCLGYRIRYILDLNAREAMHVIELRSGREGHPSYRAIAHEMHRLIAEIHPGVAMAMRHLDTATEPRLERITAELRAAHRRRREA